MAQTATTITIMPITTTMITTMAMYTARTAATLTKSLYAMP